MQRVDSPGGGGRLREQGPGVVCSPSFKVPTAVGFNGAASTQRGVSLPRVFQSSKAPFTELSRQELEQQVAVGLGVGRPGIRDGGASPVGSVVIRLGGAAPAGGTPGVCGRAAAGRGHAWRWPVGGSPSRGGSVAGEFGVCPGWSGGSGLEGAGGSGGETGGWVSPRVFCAKRRARGRLVWSREADDAPPPTCARREAFWLGRRLARRRLRAGGRRRGKKLGYGSPPTLE